MSYSRSFRKTVAVHYSGSVSYPASQNGGTVSYSGTEYEDVVINIHVDTDSFDESVGLCNSNVNLLTGAVVATEAAQVASIRNNAEKVGQTIVQGFFKTVRFEISQQIAELSNRIDATLVHLKELSRRCTEKQHQMEADYNRISKRYLRIFSDLDSELKNRIYELDRPVFGFREESGSSSYRALSDDSVGTVAVAGAESRQAEARIAASIAKKRAYDTINVAKAFLFEQKSTDTILGDSILDDAAEGLIYAPVCFLETTGENNRTDRSVYRSEAFAKIGRKSVEEAFARNDCSRIPAQDMERIREYFYSELAAAENLAEDTVDRQRVREYLLKMFVENNVKTY